MSYVCIHSSTTANDADKLLAAFYLCCLNTTTLAVLILAYGIHTDTDSCYSPTAADFCMHRPLFARAHPTVRYPFACVKLLFSQGLSVLKNIWIFHIWKEVTLTEIGIGHIDPLLWLCRRIYYKIIL